ncbi:hypothetical protein UlMin_039547 [Ulmus minor]
MSKCGQVLRKFNHVWFEEYPNWLEYSIAKDAAFFLCCYLFKPIIGKQAGSDSVVSKGFSNWKKKKKEIPNSSLRNCEALMKEKQHIETIIFKQSKQAKKEYRICLKASVDCVRFLLQQALTFRGHDGSDNSLNQGNFLELLQFASSLNDDIRDVTLNNAPENIKLTSPDIQKDIVNVVAVETINIIIQDIGDSLFSILVDESHDISTKEQMVVVLCYVNNKGQVIERFIGIEHVPSTTALSLKSAIDKLFSRYSLSISRLRGQGYDEASNMQGEFNGLKALILKENSCAFYVYCFAHQLQLALVAVAKKHTQVELFLSSIAIVVNVVGASAKRSDILQDKQGIIIVEALQNVPLQQKDQDIINAMSLVKVNTELLICMVCLSPIDLFSSFDKKRLIQLAEYYQDNFSTAELMALDIQLKTYIIDMRSSEEFRELKGISDLAQTMVASRKILVYPLVYRLLTLALILPVATATVERVFSTMSIVKNRLRNQIGDQWMNDSLIVYIEKEIASYIDNEVIMHRFQNMKTRRGQI